MICHMCMRKLKFECEVCPLCFRTYCEDCIEEHIRRTELPGIAREIDEAIAAEKGTQANLFQQEEG